MRDDLTVVYVTSNREREEFEEKVRRELVVASGGVPIISVSQRPLRFGWNVCVGDIGAKPENVLRQLIVGGRAAETKFVAVGESDFLYPREFFEFVPEREDVFYYPENVYVLWENHGRAFRKRLREMLSVTGREHFVRVLEKVLGGLKEGEHITNKVRMFTEQGSFWTDTPVVTFKTREGMHWRSPFDRKSGVRELPGWGSVEGLKRRFLGA